MQTVTLGALRTKARRYADFIASGSAESVFANTDINAVINEKCREYYDLLIAARGHEYFLSDAALSLSVANGASYTLPATCYEVSSVTLEWDDTTHEDVGPLNSLLERSPFTNWAVWDIGSAKAWRISGNSAGDQTIEFLPAPQSSVTARIRYVPTLTALADDGDEIVAFNGWDKLIAVGTAIELRTIKGLPVGPLQAEFQRVEARVKEMADERLANYSARIVDTGDSGLRWPNRRRFYSGGT